MMPPRAESIDEFLSTCSPRARRLAQAARRQILRVVPAAIEELRPGWGLIGYNAPSYFAFIVAGRDSVRIGFEWGVMLSDPSRLLDSGGSQVRYLTIRSARDLRSPAVTEFLRAAAAIRPPPRARASRK